ncbi:hypothetical protein QJS10_CPB20g01543 [Acorus calamus]|uniref:Uncharacterized protein n=1 Tax=Acorus calamus TaxID=4465 RepID=A0AAV9CDJ3_ACOCL|nr:hypothetical protein QJS10_CPB20g01543 [Acorus calamus]
MAYVYLLEVLLAEIAPSVREGGRDLTVEDATTAERSPPQSDRLICNGGRQ